MKKNQLLNFEETVKLIKDGNKLVISAEEVLLDKLPPGNWIGGTIPYFYIKGEKGKMDKESLFVHDFTDIAEDYKILTYNKEGLQEICQNGFNNGFHFIILPALQKIHLSFALNSPDYNDLYLNPLVGLVAGVDLDEFANGRKSKVYNGETGESFDDSAVVLHVELAENQVARLEILNVFDQESSPVIEVQSDSFTISDCLIGGKEGNLYDFIKETGYDTRYPFTSDYAGALINASIQRLDDDKKEVVFYAPLFKGKKYYPAKHIENYAELFREKVTSLQVNEDQMIFNCNCILNYLYGNLEENDIGFSGVATFGEVAYNLLNQTFTYLVIDES